MTFLLDGSDYGQKRHNVQKTTEGSELPFNLSFKLFFNILLYVKAQSESNNISKKLAGR